MFTIPPLLGFFRKLGKSNQIKQILRSTSVGPGIFLAKIKAKTPAVNLLVVGVSAIILGLAFSNLLGGEKGAFILRANLGGPEISEEKVDLNNAIKNSGVSSAPETVLSSQDKEEDEIVDLLGYLVVGEDALSGYLSPSALIDIRTGLMNYEVKEGDSPAKIAEAFGITTNTLLWANGLSGNSFIKPGQKLVILPVSGVRHEVKSGDTVTALVKKYGGQEDKIIAFNNLSPDGSLKPGMTLIIPDGRMPTASTPKPAQSSGSANLPALSGYFIYPTTGYNWGRLHYYNAVDIANSCGTPIYAAAAGIIREAVSTGTCRSCNRGYGLYILMEHFNGTKTRYAHLSRLAVRAGSYVDQGQLIGYMGNTGTVYGPTGCHLHFEVYGARNPLVK